MGKSYLDVLQCNGCSWCIYKYICIPGQLYNYIVFIVFTVIYIICDVGVCMKLVYGLFTTKNPKSGDSTLEVRLNMVEVERSLQNVYLYNTHNTTGNSGHSGHSGNSGNNDNSMGYNTESVDGNGHNSRNQSRPTRDSSATAPGYGTGGGIGSGSGLSHGIQSHGDLNSMSVDGSFMNTDVSHTNYSYTNGSTNININTNSNSNSTLHSIFPSVPVPPPPSSSNPNPYSGSIPTIPNSSANDNTGPSEHMNTNTSGSINTSGSSSTSASHHPFTIPEEEAATDGQDYVPTLLTSDTETESDFSGTESEVEIDGPIAAPGFKRSISGSMSGLGLGGVPGGMDADPNLVLHPRTRDMIQMSTQLRAKGMLYYRTFQLHRSLASLFLVHRPITRLCRSIWDFFTLKAINNVNELMDWMCMDIDNDRSHKSKSRETSQSQSMLGVDHTNIPLPHPLPIGMSATHDTSDSTFTNSDVTYMPSESMNHKLAVMSEYRNVHRDVLELIAPDYEISGQRKLATAIRMRNSYQCLAPPTH